MNWWEKLSSKGKLSESTTRGYTNSYVCQSKNFDKGRGGTILVFLFFGLVPWGLVGGCSSDRHVNRSNREQVARIDRGLTETTTEVYKFRPTRVIPDVIRSRNVEVQDTGEGRQKITCLEDPELAFIGGDYFPDAPGSVNIHVKVDPNVGHTTLAGLKFADSCVVNIWKDGTIEVNKEGVLATDSKGSEFKSRRVSIGARDVVVMMKWVSGLAKRLRHEEPLQNVENVHVLCPGESKTVALDEDEEATFRFSLPQFGKCEFRISTDSATPIELKTGPVVFSISKSQPFSLLVEYAEGKDLTPFKVCNVTGRKTPAFMAELGSLSASEGMSIPVMIRGTLRNLRQLKDECFDLSKAYLQIVAWSEDEKAVIRTTSRGTAILVSDFPKVPFPADGTFEFQVLQLKPGRKYVLAAQEIVKPHDRTIGPLLVYTYDPPSGKLVEIEIDPAHAKTGKEQKLVIELGEICVPPRRDENGWQIPESAYE